MKTGRPVVSEAVAFDRASIIPREVPKPKLSLRRDNPGGDWLRSERARAAETGNLGNITAYLYDDAGNRHVMLNPKDLVDIPGTMGEQASRGRGRKAADVREWMSRGEAMEHPIFITVDYRGRPKISEGNNRMAVAAELGLEEVPVEIRWYSGGEEIEGAWSPANVERRMRGEPIEVNQQSLDVVDEIDNERRESLRKEIQDLMDWLDEQVD